MRIIKYIQQHDRGLMYPTEDHNHVECSEIPCPTLPSTTSTLESGSFSMSNYLGADIAATSDRPTKRMVTQPISSAPSSPPDSRVCVFTASSHTRCVHTRYPRLGHAPCACGDQESRNLRSVVAIRRPFSTDAVTSQYESDKTFISRLGRMNRRYGELPVSNHTVDCDDLIRGHAFIDLVSCCLRGTGGCSGCLVVSRLPTIGTFGCNEAPVARPG